MAILNRRTQTRTAQVAAHLQQRGHISEGTALVEYGRFRLGDAIFRLRTSHRHLLPEGKEIVTVHKTDTKGDRYGEYHLVSKRSAAARRQVAAARSGETSSSSLSNGNVVGVHSGPTA